MAKGLRSKSKVASRNARRYTVGSDYEVTRSARLNQVAARLAERTKLPKVTEVERGNDGGDDDGAQGAPHAQWPCTNGRCGDAGCKRRATEKDQHVGAARFPEREMAPRARHAAPRWYEQEQRAREAAEVTRARHVACALNAITTYCTLSTAMMTCNGRARPRRSRRAPCRRARALRRTRVAREPAISARSCA